MWEVYQTGDDSIFATHLPHYLHWNLTRNYKYNYINLLEPAKKY